MLVEALRYRSRQRVQKNPQGSHERGRCSAELIELKLISTFVRAWARSEIVHEWIAPRASYMEMALLLRCRKSLLSRDEIFI